MADAELHTSPLLPPPLLLHLSLLFLAIHCPAQGQQQSMTDYVYGGCNVNTYQTNSSFARNRNTVVATLVQTASEGLRYYLTNVTDDPDNSSWVYGTFQCRGDLSTAENCSACLGAATGYGCTNGPAVGMRVQLLGCYYRYENYEFTSLDVDIWRSNCSSQKNSTLVYQAELNATLELTVVLAPAYGGYYAINIGSAHALSECLGYLSPSDCSACLSQSSFHSSICNTSSSGYFYYSSCYYLFSDSPLRLINTSSAYAPSSSVIQAPTRPPAISPSPAYLRGATPNNDIGLPIPAGYSSTSTSSRAIVLISVGAASAVAMVAVAAFCVARAVNRRRYVEATLRLMGGSDGTRPFMKISSSSEFSIKVLQSATERFHSRNKLGQGGFGVVYKGTLRNGMEVAIKIISPGRHDNVDFMNEAKLIATVQHRNLIQLLGYAMDNYQWYLVYEYLPNRSLDRHLFVDSNRVDEFEALALDWKTRFNIICGIARGLCYLHEESQLRIVHRDIKPGNILLDNNLEPKIADFGLARLFTNDVSHLTTAVAGTLGYLAPEYAMGGQLSEKVDVYSFGLVTLEIVSGRRAIQNNVEDAEQSHILQWAWALYERKQVLEMVDRRILMTGTAAEELEGEVERAVQLALLCTQARPQDRPTMSQICRMLPRPYRSSSPDDIDLRLPSRPGIISMGILSISDSHQFSDERLSHDQIYSGSIARMRNDSLSSELYPR